MVSDKICKDFSSCLKPTRDFGIFHLKPVLSVITFFGSSAMLPEHLIFANTMLPILEPLDLFIEKSGPEIVSQLFHFQDKGERAVALRPNLLQPWHEWWQTVPIHYRSQLNGIISASIFGMSVHKKVEADPFTNSMPIFLEKIPLGQMPNSLPCVWDHGDFGIGAKSICLTIK